MKKKNIDRRIQMRKEYQKEKQEEKGSLRVENRNS